MRLVIVNPHDQQIAQSVGDWLVRRRSVNKYYYLLDELIRKRNYKVAFLVDGRRSSLARFGVPRQWLGLKWCRIEGYLWLLRHGVNPWRFIWFDKTAELKPAEDVLMVFAKTELTLPDANRDLLAYRGLTAVNMTHYFIGTKQIANKVKVMKRPRLIAEANLKNNDYFQHHFGQNQAFSVLPFAWQKRFRDLKAWPERKNKCVALGTIFEPDFPDYRAYYGQQPFHPMRVMIYKHREELNPYLDCLITPEDDDKADTQLKINKWQRAGKKYIPYFIWEKIAPSHRKLYFSFDMVQKYNEYRMFVSPEEIVGLPSINAVEGMAAGCAYLGAEDSIYRDWGLTPGQHYVSYQAGSREDLVERIKYYQRRPEELRKIAHAGRDFVRERFSEAAIAERLWQDLERQMPGKV